MRIKSLVLALPFALAACSNALDVPPTSSIPSETAISNAPGARAALNGAYAALQSSGYYGETIINFLEVASDNARASGTLTTFSEASAKKMQSSNAEVTALWNAIYRGIDRANELIQKVPGITDLSDTERNQILGEAYFLRALHYHNLVKLYGGVPLVTEPATSLAVAAQATRATPAAVYAQILADIGKSKTLMTKTQTRQGSVGAALALESRVKLYQKDWAGAEAAALAVEGMGYALAPAFGDLFNATGATTKEDIFRVIFTPAQFNLVGYYYLTRGLGGRYEAAPTTSIIAAFDPASNGVIGNYKPTDARGIWSIKLDGSRTYSPKYPSTIGAEHVHVIRLGEVILIRAEALAQLNRLPEAVAEYNKLRVRANLAPEPTTGRTQADVLAAIARERRLELAFEGDRYPDIQRTGIAAALNIPITQTVLPIPQNEIDTAPGITQNTGY
ncbi:MAG TPA: RagB/SusD family nutrient uptake outer membrane protein [Gemmatimonadaceae bacterium]|nr:RagB/SusD family nutrient uptake outer membrane protein [Gemmatimonadaceae bacterium]